MKEFFIVQELAAPDSTKLKPSPSKTLPHPPFVQKGGTVKRSDRDVGDCLLQCRFTDPAK